MSPIALSCWREMLSRWSVCLLLLALAAPLFAQPAAPAQPAEKAEETPPLREQSIYIPYARLRSMFEKEGRGVFLPYDKFQELWQAAQKAARRIEEIKPPIAALITQAESNAVILDKADVVQVSARITIEALGEGWLEVPLRLRDTAILAAKLGDQPARILHAPDGYKLLFEKKGKQPEQFILQIDYARAYKKAPGMNSVAFEAPIAPVNRWIVRAPQAGMKVNVYPKLSAAEAMAEMLGPDAAKPDDKKETMVEAFVGAADNVRLEWTPKSDGAAGLKALATVQVQEEVTIDERVVRTKALLSYDISRSELTSLKIEVPADQTVVNVLDDNVKGWSLKADNLWQTITVELYQPARGPQKLSLELERFVGDKDMPQEMTRQQIKAPVIRAVDADRQQGVAAVKVADTLRSEIDSRVDLQQIDAAALPPGLAGRGWTYAFRYSRPQFDLTLTVESVKPQVEVDQLSEIFFEPQQATLSLQALYTITRAGVFQLEVDVPEGYEIRRVEGLALGQFAAAAVDSHHIAEREVEIEKDGKKETVKTKTRLVVNLARKALGMVGLVVEMQKQLSDANLLAPTGNKSALDLPVMRVNPASAQRSQGRLLVYAPESLNVHPTEQVGLRIISPAEAVQGIESLRHGRFPGVRELLAFAYTQESARLKVEAERRKPYIEVRQLLSTKIDSGLLKFEATFDFDIRYSGVKTLRLDVPSGIVDRLQRPTASIRHRVLSPDPKDVDPGYTALELSGEGELFGAQQVKFAWEPTLGELPVGKPIKINMPVLKPYGVDRSSGQITAAKAETVEIGVEGQPVALRPIDPRVDLFTPVPDAARAFEFHDNAWALTLTATRYDLEEVKRTSIERALVRMVCTLSNKVTVQALYRVRSARQRIALTLPAGVDLANAFDSQPLRINGTTVELEKDQTNYYIPLVGRSPDTPFIVELRYTFDGGPGELALPEFPEEPAVQQVHLAAYLPEDWKLVGMRGPWTQDPAPQWPPGYQGEQSDAQLLNELRGGIDGCQSVGDDFSKAGRLHLFAALRPKSGDSLHLVTARKNSLSLLVFLAVAITGLVLTLRPAADRLWWLALLFALLVISAVFWPTFAGAVIDQPLCAAVCLVLVAWIVRFLVWAVPKITIWIATRPIRAAAAATVVAAAAATATTQETPAAQPPGESPFQEKAPDKPSGDSSNPPANPT